MRSITLFRYSMKYILFTLIFLPGFLTSHAQLSKKYPGYEQQHFQSMRYGFFKPAGYDKNKSYPLVIYLHGSRDTVSRDMVWYQESVQKQNPVFVITPKCENPDQGWGNTWTGGHTIATASTLKLIDSLATVYNIDRDRLYLYGISMGGFGVFSIVAKEKGKFAAAYAICGGSAVNAAPQLMDTPLWIFHGDADDVVPVYLSRDVYKEIIKLGGKKVKYTEYPGVKHNSWENVSQEKALIPWVLAQRKEKLK
ncbi:MAG TPA: alpha/beta hydrolase-fold protein [Ohtaekwangia sp.]